MTDKEVVLENAARKIGMLARAIRDRDIELFDSLTHDIRDSGHCYYREICVDVDLCEVKDILDRGDL